MHSYKAFIDRISARVLGLKPKCSIHCFVNGALTLAFPRVLSFALLAEVWCLLMLSVLALLHRFLR